MTAELTASPTQIGNAVATRSLTGTGAHDPVGTESTVGGDWKNVGELGFVHDPPIETDNKSTTGGANLRAKPTADAELVTFLPFGTRVFVEAPAPGLAVVRGPVQDPHAGINGAVGYVSTAWLIWLNPPDPDSRLYSIQPGDGLQAVVEKHQPYQGYVRTGDDARSLVMAVYVANIADKRTKPNVRLNPEKLAEAKDDQGILDSLDEYRQTLGPILQIRSS